MRLSLSILIAILSIAAIEAPRCIGAELKAVGVLGNTAGMSDRPVPYAYYTGIGMDGGGRLFLAGSEQGVVVCDQDGHCLAVLTLPDEKGIANSIVARAGESLFFIAVSAGGSKSALYRLDTKGEDAAKLAIVRVTQGPGSWAISPTTDALGRVIVGQSNSRKLKYTTVAIDPASGAETALFTIDEPHGATSPWRHFIQRDADGSLSIEHHGGVNFVGRYDPAGNRLGDALGGQILDGFRYHFGYEGNLRRMDLADGHAEPGDCGSAGHEIRMPTQVVRVGERYFFSGRGGALEAKFNGSNFEYTRRVGGSHVEDFCGAGDTLSAIAFTSNGNNDVQHLVHFPKSQPIGELLNAATGLHGHHALAIVEAPEGAVIVYAAGSSAGCTYIGAAKHLSFDLKLPQVQSIGQAAVYQGQLLLADPKAGVIWSRPLLDKQAPLTAWRSNLPGVTALATLGDAVFIATPTGVERSSGMGILPMPKKTPDATEWKSTEKYQGIRRIAATPEYLYVCDTAGSIVDQLDARTGKRLARFGTPGQKGPALDQLDHPYAVAADANGVYIADNGNGRIIVATTTLWRPQIPVLPRDEGGPIVAVTLPVKPPVAAGRISVNVYDNNDVTVRQLACAAPANAPINWDGRDLYGHWATPGTYCYHGIVAPKFTLKYVTSVEQSGSPAYRTPDGTGSWGGVWGYVYGICPVNSEADSDILVLWAFEEGEGGLVRMSQDGKVRWKAHLDWWMKAQQMAVACDGTSVFIVASSALGAPDGQAKYSGDFNRPLLWRVDAATGAKRPFPGTDQQNQRMFGQYLKGKRVVTDVAVRGGKIYLTAPAQNTLFVADSSSGEQVAEWKIPEVSGVTFDSKGTIIAGSGSKIVAVDEAGKVTRTIADAGGEIWSVRATRDLIAATVRGNRQQVVYFDAGGREIRAIGVAGGRPLCGKMQPDSFLEPTGLCFTPNGKLFVAEAAAPKRFTRWSADGKLEREFHGPYYYSGMFGIDEDDPQYIYGDTHGDIIRYKVDFDTGKWDVDRYWIGVYNIDGKPSGIYQQTGVPAKWWPRIRHHDGHIYWCSGSGAIVDLTEDQPRPIAAIHCGWMKQKKGSDGSTSFEPAPRGEKTGLRGTWSAADPRNGWRVTDKSAYPVSGSGPQQGWGIYFDEHFTCFLHDWSDDSTGGVWEMPVAEWKGAVPIYDWSRVHHVGLPLGHGLQHGGGGARTAFAAGDAVYGFNGAYNAAHLPGVGHGADWEFSQITKYDAKTGKPLWHAGERAAGFATPGQMYCPTGAGGIVNDYLFWTDENSLVHAWDVEHGLYVDTLLEDGMRGPPPSPYTVWVELFNTRVFKHPKTGKVYLMAASDAIHIYEVLGTDQKPVRFDGQFTLTQADLDRAQATIASRSVSQERTLRIPRATGPVTIDGNLEEFAKAPAVELNLRDNAHGTARLMHDDKNLYVAFDVADDSPWKNAGSDLTTLFKTGDCVDVWIGPSAGKRALGTKDVRVLFAPVSGKTTAVAFRPKVEKGDRPVSFRSPSGQVMMDRVEILADVQSAVKVEANGYRLEAAIPLADLGLGAASNRIGLDLSINFSDPAGQRNVARIHWGRNGAAMVYDLPTEAKLEPETWGVGILER